MNVELAYNAYGDPGQAPPVLILHGLLGSARNWASFARQLGATRRVFTLDLRNHGASPWADEMSYDEMAEDVRAFLASHGSPAAVAIGHSMGGKVAMRLALRHGDLIERLVVVDVAPVAYERGFNAYVDAMRALDLAGISRRSDADALLAERITDPGVRGFLLQNLVSGEDGFSWRVPLATLADNMPVLTGWPPSTDHQQYQGPTLFVIGGRSDYVREEHRDSIMRLFPNAKLVTIPEAGHWVQAEAPGPFLEIVGEFLA